MQRHDEEKQVVVLTSEDMKNVKDFFDHFKIETPVAIATMMTRFNADPKSISFHEQKVFRAHIAHALSTVNHPLVKDKAFANIRIKCDKVWYDAQFDTDVEDLFSQPREKDAQEA